MTKRIFDITIAVFCIVVIMPLLLMIGILIKLDDWGPVLYKQERIGFKGRKFRIWKFRSMRVNADKTGPSITRSADSRITRVGHWLRKTKMDELPQLFNVVRGEMSLVGPRPEVEKYVKLYTPAQTKVLDLLPGITDLASIEFRDEEALLAKADDMEQFYVSHCLPNKIELNLRHAAHASIWEDIKILIRTIVVVIRGH